METAMPKWLTWFLKIFFEILYNQLAWTYDLVSWIVSVGLWNDWVRAVVPFIKGPNILELGHGPGHLQKALYNNGHSPFGIDISTNMGRICQRRLKKSDHKPRLLNGSALNLPYPTNSFDQIVATFPTEYMVEPQTIKEIYRTLVPAGELIILPEARFTSKSIIFRGAAWLFKVTGQSREADGDNIYQVGKKLFEDAGFDTLLLFIDLPTSKVVIFKAIKS
jgi:ubiquinone/menaquinone biosynthesis C-methylase UbiE